MAPTRAPGQCPPGSPLPRLLTVFQAGTMLAMTPRAVRNMISARRIPVVRIGRRIRIDISDIDQLIEEGRSPKASCPYGGKRPS